MCCELIRVYESGLPTPRFRMIGCRRCLSMQYVSISNDYEDWSSIYSQDNTTGFDELGEVNLVTKLFWHCYGCNNEYSEMVV